MRPGDARGSALTELIPDKTADEARLLSRVEHSVRRRSYRVALR